MFYVAPKSGVWSEHFKNCSRFEYWNWSVNLKLKWNLRISADLKGRVGLEFENYFEALNFVNY